MTNEVLSKIYLRFRIPIFNFVLSKVHDEQVSEEITQEVFLKAFCAKDTYRREFALSTWLWSIAKNSVFDWKRKTFQEIFSDEIENLASLEKNPEELVTVQFKEKRLRKVFKHLPVQQKKVLVLRIIHQLSYQEIANRLGLSLAAVKSVIHRAKTRFQYE